MGLLLCHRCLFCVLWSLSPYSQSKKILKVIDYEVLIRVFFYCFLLPTGLQTYLISGGKSEHDVQCGCSQVGLPGGDCVGVGRSSCPQPHTPDLIPGGAQVAEPLLSHQPPDRIGVKKKEEKKIMFVALVPSSLCC